MTQSESRARRRTAATISVIVAFGFFARSAMADETASTRNAEATRTLDRPFTVAQIGIGLLTLPAADVCLHNRPCTKGDTSIEADMWQFYRASRNFSIGAGATVAIAPTVDNPPTVAGIERTHTRSYFLVEAQGRYYPIHQPWIEAWVGVTAGGVIVSDRYKIEGGEDAN